MKTTKLEPNRGTSGNGHTHRRDGNGHRATTPTARVKSVTANKSPNNLTVKVIERKDSGLTIQVEATTQSRAEGKSAAPWFNPTQFDRPTYLMNFPFSYATGYANNPWMTDLEDLKRQPDYVRAAVQFLSVYRSVSAEALVYLLPTPRGVDLQDLLYTANLGIVLEHLPGKNTAVISNFTSAPRQGETPVGVKFFQDMGYNVIVSPHKFEGEAELKHLYDNIYVGGYGIRSEKETYDWMERQFDMRIIKVRETEKYLYHLDCTIFPITRENTIVCTELFTKQELAEIGKFTNVIPVTVDEAFSGICNSVRLPHQVLNSSHIHELKAGTEDYQFELQKNRKLEDIASNLALDVAYFNLSEFHKSGALLSCMVMHLNRSCYKIALTA